MLERLRVGDRVLLSSAIFAKVVAIRGMNLTVEIAKGVRVEVLRDAVRQLVECEGGANEKRCHCEDQDEAAAVELPDSLAADGEETPVDAKPPRRPPGRPRMKK